MTRSFTAEYRVTIADINYGGHLGNDRPLTIFHDARIQFLNSMGYSEKSIGDESGIIMVESGVRYKREVFLHDMLQVEITVSYLKPKKFCLEYRAVRHGDDDLVFSGFTSFLAFDYSVRKVSKIPAQFLRKISAYCTCAEEAHCF